MMIQDEPRSGTGQPSVRIALKVVPGSRKDAIIGPLGERLKIKVSAPPEDGRANKAVCRLIAAAAGVSTRAVEVVAGHTNPEKVVRLIGKTAAELLPLWGG
jgi:uncharacterized protein